MASAGEEKRGAGRHLVLFDGVCGLCNRLVRFILRRDGAAAFDFASLQSATGQAWLRRWQRDPNVLNTVILVTDYRSASAGVRERSDAALFIAGELDWPWRLFSHLHWVPRPLRDAAYDGLAAVRYRVFGRHDTCPVPSPAERRRFIDL